jgi:hypothetical protein
VNTVVARGLDLAVLRARITLTLAALRVRPVVVTRLSSQVRCAAAVTSQQHVAMRAAT